MPRQRGEVVSATALEIRATQSDPNHSAPAYGWAKSPNPAETPSPIIHQPTACSGIRFNTTIPRAAKNDTMTAKGMREGSSRTATLRMDPLIASAKVTTRAAHPSRRKVFAAITPAHPSPTPTLTTAASPSTRCRRVAPRETQGESPPPGVADQTPEPCVPRRSGAG